MTAVPSPMAPMFKLHAGLTCMLIAILALFLSPAQSAGTTTRSYDNNNNSLTCTQCPSMEAVATMTMMQHACAATTTMTPNTCAANHTPQPTHHNGTTMGHGQRNAAMTMTMQYVHTHPHFHTTMMQPWAWSLFGPDTTHPHSHAPQPTPCSLDNPAHNAANPAPQTTDNATCLHSQPRTPPTHHNSTAMSC
ncbi:hypothetical protein BU15DRAFT_60509 [Melanogaster broomeanus]|nr:hypothetical protein BU15DRAFT_60509 [Melanogaster broomeanus]